ncbi:Subtilase family protein [Thermomonospora echinospora]|uniref:Subtilase family protein n=1 Tax=Thermomonospora echinospora TaxID=1992 RepID=A0A1H6DP86_9ACTN|nr:S8 family serine peptidase [Thermomonospora echinospora]SEG86456.1 Subtilase family protein [Thermomonospora echinospora]
MPPVHGDPKFLTQFEAIRQAYEGTGLTPAVLYDSSNAPLSVYIDDELLIDPDDLGHVLDAVPQAQEAPSRMQGPPNQVPPPRGLPGRRGRPMLVKLNGGRDALEMRERTGRRASLNHLVSIAPTGTCPADEPAPAGHPRNPLSNPDPAAGEGVGILVVDTGLVPVSGFPSRLPPDVSGRADVPENAQLPGIMREYAGHGSFIAGVLTAVAPAADVFVSNALTYAGALDEHTLGTVLLDVLDHRGWPDIISLSAGAHTADDVPLAGLEEFFRLLGEHPDTTLVACAGNHGVNRTYYPGGTDAPGVVCVGALREDGAGLACFSNHGPWVDVYAPGERLVSAFFNGTYEYRDPSFGYCRYYPSPPLYQGCTCVTAPEKGTRVDFTTGLARWSGTSFSTPIVAGMMAARMSKTKESSREAAAALLSGAGRVESAGRVLLPTGWTPTYGWAR